MNLLQRVMTLIRANINDMIDKAEDPEKMIKQLIVDLNNQLIQVKTTVAQSLADQHLLQRKVEQSREQAADYERRAQQAVDKGNDELAKAALVRFNSFTRTAEESEKQLEEQKKETEALKVALGQLEIKIGEVTRQRDVLLARHRRAVAKERLAQVDTQIHPEKLEQLIDAIGGYVDTAEARAKACEDLKRDTMQYQLAQLDTDTQVEEQLAALKAKKGQDTAA